MDRFDRSGERDLGVFLMGDLDQRLDFPGDCDLELCLSFFGDSDLSRVLDPCCADSFLSDFLPDLGGVLSLFDFELGDLLCGDRSALCVDARLGGDFTASLDFLLSSVFTSVLDFLSSDRGGDLATCLGFLDSVDLRPSFT